jgi:hypothetical protein
MRSLINYLGALAAFFVLGASMAFVNWLAQFEFLGWLALGFIVIVPFYLAVKVWRSF